MAPVDELNEKMKRVEALIDQIDACGDPKVRETALELIQTLMDFHGVGLERIMDITAKAGAAGYAIFDDLARDELTSSLLLLYGLHPLEMSERIQKAIDGVRPSLSLHEGDVEVLDIKDGIVKLRLKGSCDGCPSSALTLKHTIEEAIYAAAPDVKAIEVEGLAEPESSNGFTQITKRKYTSCEFAAAA